MSTSLLGSSRIVFKGKPSTVEIFQAIKPRMCLIKTSKGQASGCFVSKDGVVVTAMHIFKKTGNTYKQDDITIQYNGKNYTADFSPTLNANLAEKLHICLLKIKEKVETPHFDILDKKFEILEGQKLYFAGVPLTQTVPTFHKGYVSSKSGGQSALNTFTIDGTVVRGNSGGPVAILDKGKLYLAGTVTHLVADVDPDYSKISSMLRTLGNAKSLAGFSHTFNFPDGTKETLLRDRAIIRILGMLENNMSTGIGRALDARHIKDLTNKSSSLTTSNSGGIEVGKKPVMNKGKRDGHAVKFWENFRGNASGGGPRGIDVQVDAVKATYHFDVNPHDTAYTQNKKNPLKFYSKAFDTFYDLYFQNNNEFPENFSFKIFGTDFTGTLQE